MSKEPDTSDGAPRHGALPGRGGTQFNVWAPAQESLALVVAGSDDVVMDARPDGWFQAHVRGAGAGTLYQFRTADGRLIPDPASRFQPSGPHGPSMVVDTGDFSWTDAAWSGPPAGRQIIYELHVGTFTREGTWLAAIPLLDDLAELGITIIEVMPVGECPGSFNWGYDGTYPFAPWHVYGAPQDMMTFIDAAHSRRIGVILDVVYNHLGPDGNYLATFAPGYFSTRYTTDWGDALNFDGADSKPVRQFFLQNVEQWIRDYHLDGLRFDATQNIYDSGSPHILAELTARVRSAAGSRRTFVVSENESQDVIMVRPASAGGHDMDAMWNDDYHHTAMVALTGSAEAYYTDYGGSPQELLSCARHGFLYQGQRYAWQKQRRGTSTRDIEGAPFVNFIQNHDQIANSDSGRRIHELTAPALLRALTAFTILMPGHTMLFQGQEFASSSRFLFFADHNPELAARVHDGRREFLRQFRSTALPSMQERIHSAADRATFDASVLDHSERMAKLHVVRLHADLIRLATGHPVLADCDRTRVDTEVISANALALRYRGSTEADDLLLVVNLGRDLRPERVPFPILAPPAGRRWRTVLTTEDPAYGGRGGPEPEEADGAWYIVGQSAVLLESTEERSFTGD